MALAKYGLIITELKGKLGGHVLQSGSVGKIVRTNHWSHPPLTDFRDNGKILMGRLAGYWKELSNSDQQKWETWSQFYPQINKYGDTFYLTGYQLFLHLNSGLLLVDKPTLTTPPDPEELWTGTITSVTAQATPNSLIVTWDENPLSSPFNLIYETTDIYPRGIKEWFKRKRHIGKGGDGATPGQEIEAEQNAAWHSDEQARWNTNSIIRIKITAIRTDTGQRSVPYEADITLT